MLCVPAVGPAGGYFSAAEGDSSILLRLKEDYDGAEPAASSIAAVNLFKLASYCTTEQSEQYAPAPTAANLPS